MLPLLHTGAGQKGLSLRQRRAKGGCAVYACTTGLPNTAGACVHEEKNEAVDIVN